MFRRPLDRVGRWSWKFEEHPRPVVQNSPHALRLSFRTDEWTGTMLLDNEFPGGFDLLLDALALWNAGNALGESALKRLIDVLRPEPKPDPSLDDRCVVDVLYSYIASGGPCYWLVREHGGAVTWRTAAAPGLYWKHCGDTEVPDSVRYAALTAAYTTGTKAAR